METPEKKITFDDLKAAPTFSAASSSRTTTTRSRKKTADPSTIPHPTSSVSDWSFMSKLTAKNPKTGDSVYAAKPPSVKQQEVLAESKYRMRLIDMISGYYEKFPKFGGKLSIDQINQLYAQRDPAILELKLKELQEGVSTPFGEEVLRQLYLQFVSFSEIVVSAATSKYKYSSTVTMGILGNMNPQGTANFLRANPDYYDEEIKELSILYKEMFTQGPLLRLFVKTIKAMYMVNKTNTLVKKMADKGVCTEEEYEEYANL